MKACLTPAATLSTPYRDALPAQIVFRAATLQAPASYPRHRHAWGEFVYAYEGVLELQFAGHQLLVPPLCGAWLPPDLEHRGLNRQAVVHASLYLAAPLCPQLPADACVLTVDPLLRALLERWRARPPEPARPADARQLHLALDLLHEAPPSGSYLPGSRDPLLAPLLDALNADPADPRGLADWAQALHSTERTLQRRCQQQLGMGFTEWRSRLRIVRALPLLTAGLKLEAIAHELGYASAAAFIALFKRQMGVTPQAYRRRQN